MTRLVSVAWATEVRVLFNDVLNCKGHIASIIGKLYYECGGH